MKRNYQGHNDKEKVVYFVGKEIERTSEFGELTLFVAGPRPYAEIVKWHKIAEQRTKKKINHIFASANMSLKFWQHEDTETVKKLLKKFHVTIDGAPNDLCRLIPHLPKSKKLTLMVSLAIPYIKEFQKHNCFLKIDDQGFNETNPGVWCHDLKKLTTNSKFTNWDNYKGDIILATLEDLK